MQLISKFNTGFRFLLCVIDIYSKYTWVILNRGLRFLCVPNIYSKYAHWLFLCKIKTNYNY